MRYINLRLTYLLYLLTTCTVPDSCLYCADGCADDQPVYSFVYSFVYSSRNVCLWCM